MPASSGISLLPLASADAISLALRQRADGTWSGTMLTTPAPRGAPFEGVGTILAARRLVEYGWDRESPPLAHARRILFRLLAEDEDPNFLFELAPKGKPEPEYTRYGRRVLREAATAALAQAGYENDPRLRGAARRLLERTDNFLRGPLAEKPFVRAGNQHVLSPEAAPPSLHLLTMLAYMPLFRSEHFDVLDRLYAFVSQPLPRQAAASVVAGRIVAQPHLVLGDPLPHRNAVDADIPAALHWLELAARLGFLRRNEGWMRLYERFLDERDERALWHPRRGTMMPRAANPFTWPGFPLSGTPGDDRSADVTFRLGVIARHLGRPIALA
ncbi:MAG TPA: hypothetical protein VEI06_05880 [Gemmatimonadaceae bacterium]|nr:hypothetical protein [Gemmatimonadaceae bacterium]